MTRQAMQLGWLPGVSIRQTSDKVYGQIYVPVVNWLLMAATLSITVAFGTSDRLAGAYGTAVATTMLLTTILLYKAMRDVWRWPLAVALLVTLSLVIVDTSFFIANLLKIADGGWLPLTFAAILFFIMVTWRRGVDAIRAKLTQPPEVGAAFLAELNAGVIPRINGATVFLTRSPQRVSRLIIDHVRNVGVLPQHAVALSISFEDTPRIVGPRCSQVENLGKGLWRVVAKFGFLEIPNLREALKNARELDHAEIDFDQARFVGTRDLVVGKANHSVMSAFRMELFAFLYRNSVKAVDRFNLPPEHVVEIARQIEI